ncbi:MAG: translation initiation factor IF-2, partial [Prevotella sp.]
MSVRLNKALSDFNIGLQTAVDFLKKKYNLSEDLESTSKITEDQYHALEVAFKKDAETRSKADQLISNKKKDKRRPKPQRPQAAPTTEIPRVKVVGHIDLSQLETKPSQSSAQSKAAAAVGNAKPAQPQSKPQTAQAPAQPKPQQAPVEQTKPQPKAQSKPQPQAAQPASQTAQQPAPETKAETAQQPSVFKTKIEQDLQNAPKLKVMGKIDLSALNQSTRPKKKSKDERRKEREEKNQQHTGDRKKRKRI